MRMNRHTIGAVPARTRAPFLVIVVADEGGGPTAPHPYSGGVRLLAMAAEDVSG
jgi:hypothetical protein